jgi:predicted lipase
VKELHTFGSPRVGNNAFSMFVQQRVKTIWRVVHNRDIVPHVPLQNQNYHHVATEIFFD